MKLDPTKHYRARIQSAMMADGEYVEVVSDTTNSASSYGFPHWVDRDGTSWGQIDLPNPFCIISDIVEISQEDVEKFFND